MKIHEWIHMTVLTDNFLIHGGKLPDGNRTNELELYAKSWEQFAEEIGERLNSKCTVKDLFDIPYMPEEVSIKSKDGLGKNFNLPIWAAKKILNTKVVYNNLNYIVEEHNLKTVNLMSSEKFEKKLIESCHNKNYDFIKVIFDFENFQFKDKLNKKIINNLFKEACLHNDLKLIQFLYTNEFAKKSIDINTNGDAFNVLCAYGKIKVVDYLLSSTDIGNKINKSLFNYSLQSAIFGEHLNVIKSLLNIQNVEEKIDKDYFNDLIKEKSPTIENDDLREFLQEKFILKYNHKKSFKK